MEAIKKIIILILIIIALCLATAIIIFITKPKVAETVIKNQPILRQISEKLPESIKKINISNSLVPPSSSTTSQAAGNISPVQCSDGTPVGKCSKSRPDYCDNGNLVAKCVDCGCPDGEICAPDGKCQNEGGQTFGSDASACGDGTANGQCSSDKPAFCRDGRLYAACSKCGCPNDGSTCQSNESCQTVSVCLDGTPPGKCSVNKPKLCFDTDLGLVDACNSCGCPDGKTCGKDSKCK